MRIRTAAVVILLSALVVSAADLETTGRPIPILPTAEGRPAAVYVETRPPAVPQQTAEAPQETYVTVTGLDGRLMVTQEILDELGLRSGQEVNQLTMYKILEHNRKLY